MRGKVRSVQLVVCHPRRIEDDKVGDFEQLAVADPVAAGDCLEERLPRGRQRLLAVGLAAPAVRLRVVVAWRRSHLGVVVVDGAVVGACPRAA